VTGSLLRWSSRLGVPYSVGFSCVCVAVGFVVGLGFGALSCVYGGDRWPVRGLVCLG